jgi:hypothetical protein
MVESAREKLANLGIPISDKQTLTDEDRNGHSSEIHHRTLIDSQTTPADAREAEQFDLMEAVTFVPMGYFHPGMTEMKQKQLAAIISTGTPQVVNHNTPGIASTFTASLYV